MTFAIFGLICTALIGGAMTMAGILLLLSFTAVGFKRQDWIPLIIFFGIGGYLLYLVFNSVSISMT